MASGFACIGFHAGFQEPGWVVPERSRVGIAARRGDRKCVRTECRHRAVKVAPPGRRARRLLAAARPRRGAGRACAGAFAIALSGLREHRGAGVGGDEPLERCNRRIADDCERQRQLASVCLVSRPQHKNVGFSVAPARGRRQRKSNTVVGANVFAWAALSARVRFRRVLPGATFRSRRPSNDRLRSRSRVVRSTSASRSPNVSGVGRERSSGRSSSNRPPGPRVERGIAMAR
jgi:hypothetical protein